MTTQKIAETIEGIPLPVTSTGMAKKVRRVQEYYPTIVSHRVHAEHSGIGWIGKTA